jgi:hypothetical protein
MTNSTTEYWDVDGVSLQTLAFDIESAGGDRMAPPELRGNDLVIPHRYGKMWLPKQVDSRIISLDMWVIGCDEDGNPPTGSAIREFDENFRKLRQLLWTPGRQFTLTKRFYVDGVLKTASALGQYAGGLKPNMTGRSRAAFNVDIELADPYFYSEAEVVNLNTSATPLNVTVEGDAATRKIILDVNGPRENVNIRNNTMGIEVELHSDLNTDDVAEIDIDKYTSKTTPDGMAQFKSTGSIRHSGDASWLLLQPGVNAIEVTSDTGIGLVTMTYQAAWI